MNDCQSTTPDQPLPDLQQSFLDDAMLSQLFTDIQTHTELIEVIPKFSAQGYVAEQRMTLSEGQQLLRDGTLRALQIRYLYNGTEWWDTLMNTPQGIRIVRIQHDFSELNSSKK